MDDYRELSERELTVRKTHNCVWCGERIEVGERAHYRTYIWVDGFGSDWMHPECWDAMEQEDNAALCEGWIPGDYKRGSTQNAWEVVVGVK